MPTPLEFSIAPHCTALLPRLPNPSHDIFIHPIIPFNLSLAHTSKTLNSPPNPEQPYRATGSSSPAIKSQRRGATSCIPRQPKGIPWRTFPFSYSAHSRHQWCLEAGRKRYLCVNGNNHSGGRNRGLYIRDGGWINIWLGNFR